MTRGVARRLILLFRGIIGGLGEKSRNNIFFHVKKLNNVLYTYIDMIRIIE